MVREGQPADTPGKDDDIYEAMFEWSEKDNLGGPITMDKPSAERDDPDRKVQADEGPRIAYVRLLEFPGSVSQWRVICCPYCGGQHHHGAGYHGLENPRDYLGHRAPHCGGRGNRGYFLVEELAPGMTGKSSSE